MDTLVAGHRIQEDGPVSEAIVARQTDSGRVEIDLAVLDENKTEGSALLSRSFITIPASMMDKVAKAWLERNPQGITDEGWSEMSEGTDAEDRPLAANFVGSQTGS